MYIEKYYSDKASGIKSIKVYPQGSLYKVASLYADLMFYLSI